jgi:hypothetical protein
MWLSPVSGVIQRKRNGARKPDKMVAEGVRLINHSLTMRRNAAILP